MFTSTIIHWPDADSLERLTRQVAAATTPEQKAKAMMDLGDAWAAARGNSFPSAGWPARNFYSIQIPMRHGAPAGERQGARFKKTDEDLENRDELRHAPLVDARRRALPGTQLAATAGGRRFRRCRYSGNSDYAFLALSKRKLQGPRASYIRNCGRMPKSVEATKMAAYWSFPCVK